MDMENYCVVHMIMYQQTDMAMGLVHINRAYESDDFNCFPIPLFNWRLNVQS